MSYDEMKQFKKLEKPFSMMVEALKMKLDPKYRDQFLTEVFYEVYSEGYKDAID